MPVSELDDGGVVVPETNCPLTPDQLDELRSSIHWNEENDVFAIDFYVEVTLKVKDIIAKSNDDTT